MSRDEQLSHAGLIAALTAERFGPPVRSPKRAPAGPMALYEVLRELDDETEHEAIA